MSLTLKTRYAALWSTLDVIYRQGLTFGIAVAMARLLSPEEFGTVAMLALFVGVANVFVDGGFSWALIQSKETTRSDESTVFWFNLAAALLLGITLSLLGPAISRFYGAEILTPIAYCLSLNIAINALASVQIALLTKEIEFRTQATISIVAGSLAGLLAISLAWLGYGVWSLVAQTLSSSAISTALFWRYSSWRPNFEFKLASLQRLFRFGGFIFVSRLMDTVYSQFASVAVGRVFGTRELGLYNRAENTQIMAGNTITTVLGRVTFPLFSKSSGSSEELRLLGNQAIKTAMLITVPSLLGLAAVSGQFVQLVFGEKWLPCAPLLSILCFAGLAYPLHVINLNILMAQGRSDLFFRLELLKKSVGFVILLCGFSWGVMGLAYSTLLTSWLSFFVNSLYTGKSIGYGAFAQLRDVSVIVLSGVLMFVFVRLLASVLPAQDGFTFCTICMLGGLFYLLCSISLQPSLRKQLLQSFVAR
jgi:teichuronic acid exporter